MQPDTGAPAATPAFDFGVKPPRPLNKKEREKLERQKKREEEAAKKAADIAAGIIQMPKRKRPTKAEQEARKAARIAAEMAAAARVVTQCSNFFSPVEPRFYSSQPKE